MKVPLKLYYDKEINDETHVILKNKCWLFALKHWFTKFLELKETTLKLNYSFLIKWYLEIYEGAFQYSFGVSFP